MNKNIELILYFLYNFLLKINKIITIFRSRSKERRSHRRSSRSKSRERRRRSRSKEKSSSKKSSRHRSRSRDRDRRERKRSRSKDGDRDARGGRSMRERTPDHKVDARVIRDYDQEEAGFESSGDIKVRF